MSYVPPISKPKLAELGIPIMNSTEVKYQLGNHLRETGSAKDGFSGRYVALCLGGFLAGIVCPPEEETFIGLPDELVSIPGRAGVSTEIGELIQELGIRTVTKKDFTGSYLDRAIDRRVDDPSAYVGITMEGKLRGILVPMSVGTELIKRELSGRS